MTAREWQIEGAQGKCARTGRALTEGEEFYTVLYEDGESFRREDIGLDAWDGPPDGSFCHFKTRVPVKARKRRLLVDDEVLVGLFQRLVEETDPLRIQFRFVLALILMRKRILRYESSEVVDGVETWQMTLVSDHSAHRVVNPQLTDEQIDGVSAQLSAILHGDSVAAIAGESSLLENSTDEFNT